MLDDYYLRMMWLAHTMAQANRLVRYFEGPRPWSLDGIKINLCHVRHAMYGGCNLQGLWETIAVRNGVVCQEATPSK